MPAWEYVRIIILVATGRGYRDLHAHPLRLALDTVGQPPILMRFDVNPAADLERQRGPIARLLAQLGREGWELTDRFVYGDYADLRLRRIAPERA